MIRQVVSEYTNPKREAMAFFIQSVQAILSVKLYKSFWGLCVVSEVCLAQNEMACCSNPIKIS